MKLSPLAQERLARIGELSQEEKLRLEYSRYLAFVLSDYFTGRLTPEGLWQELRTQKEQGRGFLLREAQLRLIDAISLASSEADFDTQCSGILAVETLKEESNYTVLEQVLDSIRDLRRRYREESEKKCRELKEAMGGQVKLVAQQLAAQAKAKGTSIDVQGSVEATIKASPEWKSFVLQHESVSSQRLKERLARLREMV